MTETMRVELPAIGSVLAVTMAVVALAVSGGCLPAPVSGLPRTVGEMEVVWRTTGHDLWACTLRGFGYKVYLRWDAAHCEHLRASVQPAGESEDGAWKSASDGEGDSVGERNPRGGYRFFFSTSADELPSLEVENLPAGMRDAAECARRIGQELAQHEMMARSVLPEIPRAYIADMAELRFAVVPAKPARFSLSRELHYQGGRAVYVYESRGAGAETLKAYLSAGRGFFEWGDDASRGFSVLLEGDELTLQSPQAGGTDERLRQAEDFQREHLPFRAFQEKAAGMLVLLKSEGMLEAGEEEQLVDSVLDTLAAHTRYDRTETLDYGAASAPWGYVGGG